MSDSNAPRQGALPPHNPASTISENTCTAISEAAGATPENGTLATLPSPATMPATCVPWRHSSNAHGAAAPAPT